MRNTTAFADHRRTTIPSRVEPFTDAIARGDARPDGLIPIYTADGRLWFTIDLNDTKVAAAPDETAVLHEAADRTDTRSQCYFIGGSAGLVKIGHSVDPQARCSGFQCGSPVPLMVLATAPGGQVREAAYHAQFASSRQHGEWFKRTPAIRAEIKRLATVSRAQRQEQAA